MRLDKFGLLVTESDPYKDDGGDTLANEAFIRYGLCLQKRMGLTPPTYPLLPDNRVIELLERWAGVWVRHPLPGPGFWNDSERTSRHQVTSLICWLGEAGHRLALQRLYDSFKSRWYQYQNKDVGFVELFSLFNRAFNKNKLSTQLGDMWLYGDVMTRIKKGNDMAEVDDRCTVAMCAQSFFIHDTKIAKAARRKYFTERPTNLGSTELKETDPIMGALAWYFRADLPSGNSPEIAETWRPIVSHIRNNL